MNNDNNQEKSSDEKDRQEVLDKIQEIEAKIPTQIVTAEHHSTEYEKAEKKN